MFSPCIIPGILKMRRIISDNRKNKNPYSINASQNPPIMLSTSVRSDECFDSRIFAAINRIAIIKAVIE
jgi:hypothetical protein